jgi:hypothetical protein
VAKHNRSLVPLQIEEEIHHHLPYPFTFGYPRKKENTINRYTIKLFRFFLSEVCRQRVQTNTKVTVRETNRIKEGEGFNGPYAH